MLYVESRKSFKVRREKKLISLPSAKKTLGKDIVYRVQKNTRQTPFFAECFFALSIPPCLPSAIILPSVFRIAVGKEWGLPSARRIALGKPPCTQQIDCFR